MMVDELCLFVHPIIKHFIFTKVLRVSYKRRRESGKKVKGEWREDKSWLTRISKQWEPQLRSGLQ